MPFIPGADIRVGIDAYGVVLIYREMTDDERKDFDKRYARLVNAPGLNAATAEGAVKLTGALRGLKKEFSTKVLKGWEGYESAPGKPIPFNPTTVAEFFANPATRRLWEPAWLQYMAPGAAVQQAYDLEEATPEPTFPGGTTGG